APYNFLDIFTYTLPMVASIIMLVAIYSSSSMGGRFDPIAEEFKKEDWAFHLMMMVYFFFTVIVMLNVLIALINVAFTKRHDGQRLIQARLHYIELAENLSYHIPGFRETYNWFPKEIYFAATAKEIEEYREEALKTHVQKLEVQLAEQKELVQRQLSLQQEKAERQFQELKDLLLLGRPEGSKAEI
ncbi:hypothetical protein BGZ70_004036, partial [Mortierella alpina]